ncbi:MAG: DUF1579 domain-containing protein [Calditrichaeota bacterium]|nr:MAG: DUF1579 domain-containing protein [Calditrichota bacterium]
MSIRRMAIFAFVLLCWCFVPNGGVAQNRVRPCDTPEGKQFDFWVGRWDLTWPAEQMGGEKGQLGHGSNTVTKILDDCIVQEQFRFPAGNFNGTSVSVYNLRTKRWQQTWVDNQGGYLLFTGGFKDGKMELRTPTYQRNGKTIVSRMVFRNIAKDSFDWDWQRSSDGGNTWQDVWNIHYRRKK